MIHQLRPAFAMVVVMSVLTGVAYPLLVTGIAQMAFPHQAGGSLVRRGDTVIGSELIGQAFTRSGYFRSRPSAAGTGYDATASGGSNLGPTSATLVARVDSLLNEYRNENPRSPVPIDLVTASGGGLDPHISPASAEFQVPRVARERGVSETVLRALVGQHTERRTFGLLGEPRVNVLLLNLALDRSSP